MIPVTFDPSPGALWILKEGKNLFKFSPLTHQQFICPHVKHVPGSFPWEGSYAAVTKLHLAFADRVILKRDKASVNTLLLLLTPSHFYPPPHPLLTLFVSFHPPASPSPHPSLSLWSSGLWRNSQYLNLHTVSILFNRLESLLLRCWAAREGSADKLRRPCDSRPWCIMKYLWFIPANKLKWRAWCMGTDGPSIDAVLLRWRWREREGWWERGKEKKKWWNTAL